MSTPSPPRLAVAYLRYLGELGREADPAGQKAFDAVRNRLTPKDDIEERAFDLAARALRLARNGSRSRSSCVHEI